MSKGDFDDADSVSLTLDESCCDTGGARVHCSNSSGRRGVAIRPPRTGNDLHRSGHIDPVTKTEVAILIDQHLGGTTELTLGYLVVPPGVDVPNHIHQSTETFYILSGEMEQTSEGKVQTLSAGMACLVPADTTTRHTVKSKDPVHALVIWTPGGEEERITKEWQVKAAQ